MDYFPSAVAEFSGTGVRGNQSSWMVPSTATVVTGMMWSRVSGVDAAPWLPFNPSTFNTSSPYWQTSNGSVLSWDEVGMFYPVDSETVWVALSPLLPYGE
ncbi:hypothetical protein F4825DRAFT_456063 [Nemania diffusa]|nr:hypothetical protein F4825DRAFT_456063 [Nemania diffusa]